MSPAVYKKSVHVSIVLALCAVVVVGFEQPATASTLCVNPGGSQGCFSKIQSAVNSASAGDIIKVAAGTYSEQVTIGISISVLGAGSGASIIDATGLAHGIFVNGFEHSGLHDVIVSGFKIENALFEGVLVVSAADVIIRDNSIINNDKSSGLEFTGVTTGCPDQPGNGTYETDETGDCGGALHLVGTVNATVSGNLVTGNADGVLISDETGESRGNVIAHNSIIDNPLECGIVLASHPPAGKASPPFAPHYGVDNNVVSDNVSTGNGVQIGGSGVGLFSDGAGQGRVTGNLIIGNKLVGNGLGGVALHTHVGPAFGLPADNFDGNMIIGNFISGNHADLDDTATPGGVGININSGGGGSPVRGTVIEQNVITDEDVDVAINTPAVVNVHLNDLLGKKVGVADVCAFDHATICTGTIDATENFWGCGGGPGSHECTTASGTDIRWAPWLGGHVGGTQISGH